MKNILKKLKTRKGETLVGILVAILIIALSAGLFAVMYNASMSINLSAREQDEKLYDAVTQLENKSGSKVDKADGGEIKIEIHEANEDGTAGAKKGEVRVDVYEQDGLIAYSEDTP